MGACLSSKSLDYQNPSANVVLLNGDLRQFPVPITVSQLLLQLDNSSTDSFICNSDCLYFDDYIPALAPEDALQESQIYFVLPKTKLHYRLSASDMAALAVKASVALDKINATSAASTSRRKRKARISPVMVLDQNIEKKSFVNNNNTMKPSTSARLGVSRSSSVKKLQRYSSRRAKMAARSFRIRLSTIYEGSVAHAPF